MAFDIGKWGADLGLSAEEVKQAEAILSKPERLAKLEKGYLAASDYNRSMDEGRKKLQDAQADYERRGKELTESLAAVDRLKDDTTGALEKAVARAEKAEERAGKAEVVLRKTAVQAGLEPDDVVKELGAPIERPAPVAPVVDDKDLDKRFGEIGNRVGIGMRTVADLAAEIVDLQAEHQALFGKPLTGARELVDLVAKSGGKLSARDVWSEKFKVPERQAELHEAEIQRRIDEAKKDEGIRVRSEMALGVERGTEGFEYDSPVLRHVKPIEAKNARGGTAANAATLATAQGLRERIAKIRASGVK